MSKSRLPSSNQDLDAGRASAIAPPSASGSPLLALQASGAGGNAFAQSLLAPGLDAALGACFGPGAAGVQVASAEDAKNRDLGALASTEGRRVSLSSAVQPSEGDRQSLEVLGHEFSHALAGGGSRETELDQPGDPGEARADQAGRRFADYVQGGMRGPAPQIQPATGGRARVHRFESSEHVDAVDGALDRLASSKDPALIAKGQQASALLDPSKPITIGEGDQAVELTPGQITAMMGDFYGAFDEDGSFNAGASFQQLMSADPAELKGLAALMQREKYGDEIMPGEWEEVLKGREGKSFAYTDPATGETKSYQQLGYLDLAARNNNHFSGPTMSGTDNNMGTYTAFHEMALAEAQRLAADGGSMSPEEKAEAMNRLRTLESCSSHYLTDRHAGGHNFEKQGVMDASGYNETGWHKWDWPGAALALEAAKGQGTVANLFVKTIHDDWNERGIPVNNVDGQSWLAKGDGHWADADNEENRLRTADSVATSWGELQSVLDGDTDAGALREQGYGAYSTVPQWNDGNQAAAERISSWHTFADVSGGLALDYGASYGKHYGEKWFVDPVQDAVQGLEYKMWQLEEGLKYQAMSPNGF